MLVQSIDACCLCREYKVLNILEFNSTRKRMSVILRDPDNQIIIMCKGADRFFSLSLKLCIAKSVATDAALLKCAPVNGGVLYAV